MVFDPASRGFLHSAAHGSRCSDTAHCDIIHDGSKSTNYDDDARIAPGGNDRDAEAAATEFVEVRRERYNRCAQSMRLFEVVSYNPSTYGAKKGVQILQMTSRLARATLRFTREKKSETCQDGSREVHFHESSSDENGGDNGGDETVPRGSMNSWSVRSSNVQRFELTHVFQQNVCYSPDAPLRLQVDGSTLDIPIIKHGMEICRVDNTTDNGGEKRHATLWDLCGRVDASAPGDLTAGASMSNTAIPSVEVLQRTPADSGPARQAFQSPFVIVAGTSPRASPHSEAKENACSSVSPKSSHSQSCKIGGHVQATSSVSAIALESIA